MGHGPLPPRLVFLNYGQTIGLQLNGLASRLFLPFFLDDDFLQEFEGVIGSSVADDLRNILGLFPCHVLQHQSSMGPSLFFDETMLSMSTLEHLFCLTQHSLSENNRVATSLIECSLFRELIAKLRVVVPFGTVTVLGRLLLGENWFGQFEDVVVIVGRGIVGRSEANGTELLVTEHCLKGGLHALLLCN